MVEYHPSIMKKFPALLIVLVLLISNLSAGCSGTNPDLEDRTPLVVFGAGSLIIPFADMEQAFEKQYPQIDVQAQYHGSIQVMRHVTDLHEPIDVVATADASLIPMLMYASRDPLTGNPYADWFIRFASNRLSIAYQPDSRYASDITPENWFEILSRPDVSVGLADPRFDAAGYRMLMTSALAREYYGKPSIFLDLFRGQFTFPIGIFSEDGLTTLTVPEIMETTTGSHFVLRGASIELIALLESGDLDYAFEYESVILQHGLKILELPAALNLGVENEQAFYATVQVNEKSQRFASVEPVFHGERIGYGITIPENATHPEEAALFISFLLSQEGRAIMEANHHQVFMPPVCDQPNNIPSSLLEFCTSEAAP